ncbi:MAG: hypothetical protein ACQGVK_09800 [Myxococcota bacterium]
MSTTAQAWDGSKQGAEPGSDAGRAGRPAARSISPTARRLFLAWTAAWWGGVGVCAALFFFGVLEFAASAKVSLYGISIWLNGWLLAYVAGRRAGRARLDLYHDCLVVWVLSYAMTNLLWEIPWVLASPFVFHDLHSLDDVVAQTGFMRSSLLNMYWWVLASFSSVDLRTVNHDPTFYSVEIFSFVNVATTLWFLHLNRKRSPYRYAVVVLGCGEPIAATFIFSFAEVFGGFENMAGGVADTLLALLWTQYQYFLFPMIFGYMGFVLLREDWRRADAPQP